MNVLTATVGLGLVIGALALVDPRIREELAQILTGHAATTQIGGAVATIRDSVQSAAGSVREQAAIYAPLTMFGIAAAIFVFFMTRIKF